MPAVQGGFSAQFNCHIMMSTLSPRSTFAPKLLKFRNFWGKMYIIQIIYIFLQDIYKQRF